jgi:hypothetical protein
MLPTFSPFFPRSFGHWRFDYHTPNGSGNRASVNLPDPANHTTTIEEFKVNEDSAFAETELKYNSAAC